jgi:uncharacterized membrane protein YeaQ/YmgE (transglycosylase-associated protein family)
MNITVDQVATWIIVGALAGSLAGLLVTRKKQGFGHIFNLAVGLAGALIGGVAFKLFRINLGILGEVTITLEEVIKAFLGSLLFLAIIWFVRRQWAKKAQAKSAGGQK